MNKSTYGETLFAEYLTAQGAKFDREPPLPGISQLIDFVVDHSTHGKILLEVKDIENEPPPRGFSQFDSYRSIRSHIKKGSEKFKSTSDYICALVLVAPPGSFVPQFNEAHAMLGAMYGDFGFRIPFDPIKGEADADQIRADFIMGKGKMAHPSGVQNKRIAALITIQQFAVWNLAMKKYLNTDNGRSRDERYAELMRGEVDLPDENERALGLTVWENALASRKLPDDMFRGEMDAWWEADGKGNQSLTFIGARRRELGIDDRM